MPASFIDTNVLVYMASGEPEKADRAESLLREPGGVISVQVLEELANVARRKMRLSWAETRTFLDTIRALLPARPLTEEIFEAATDLAERHLLSVYDAMIVASALDAGCAVLWSEDMQHGMTVEGRLRIQNPFRAPP